jgi:hypothetical protein
MSFQFASTEGPLRVSPLISGVSWATEVSFAREHNRAYTLTCEVRNGLENVHHS